MTLYETIVNVSNNDKIVVCPSLYNSKISQYLCSDKYNYDLNSSLKVYGLRSEIEFTLSFFHVLRIFSTSSLLMSNL